MRFAWVLLLVGCWSASSSSPPAPQPAVARPAPGAPAPLPFPTGCVAPGDPAVADVQRRATEATRAGFAAELSRTHLHVIALGVHGLVVAQGLSYTPRHPQGTAVTTTVGGVSGTFVAAETAWSGDPSVRPAWEFVQDDRGDVFRAIRQPRAATTHVVLCGCEPQHCGPPGSGCPACGSTAQTMYGPLPAGARYRGELAISYPANVVTIAYEAKPTCPPPPLCTQPP